MMNTNTRLEDTWTTVSDTFLSLAKAWPFARRANPLGYAAIGAAGLLAGVGIGLAIAPQSGTELRANLAERVRTFQKRAGSALGAVVEHAEEAAGDVAAEMSDDARRADGRSPTRHASHKTARA